MKRRLDTEQGLRRALDNGEFELFYQPKVDLERGGLLGSEALLRWEHPTLGRVSPVEFIPIAEDTGQIVSIGRWVLKEACRQAVAWRDEGLPPMTIGVNLSAAQLQHGNLVSEVETVLADTGLDPRLLDLELTESMLVSNPNETIEILERLKALGISISMDDFGTGYSSLSYLTRFQLDSLKIDRSFVMNLPNDRDAAAVVRAIVSMARNLDLKLVAEGIETEGQVGFLNGLGCQVGQGYLFSPPVPAADFKAFATEGLNSPRREQAEPR